MSPDTEAPPAARDPHARVVLDIQERLQGARADFEVIVRDLTPTVTGFVFNQSRRPGRRLAPDDVEDIVNEAWGIAWTNFSKKTSGYRDTGAATFRGYVCGIAQKCLLRRLHPRKLKVEGKEVGQTYLSEMGYGASLADHREAAPGPRVGGSQEQGRFFWLLDTLHLLDACLDELPLLKAEPAAEPDGARKSGPGGSRAYTGLRDLRSSVEKVLKLKGFGYPGAGDPAGADDE